MESANSQGPHSLQWLVMPEELMNSNRAPLNVHFINVVICCGYVFIMA